MAGPAPLRVESRPAGESPPQAGKKLAVETQIIVGALVGRETMGAAAGALTPEALVGRQAMGGRAVRTQPRKIANPQTMEAAPTTTGEPARLVRRPAPRATTPHTSQPMPTGA